jgi:hypothetical protein
VLGANLLIFLHLAFLSYQLVKSVRLNTSTQKVEAAMVSWFPVYSIWAAIVVFLFPFIFSFG